MNGKVALATNTAIAALNGDTVVVSRIQDADQIFLPLPVIGELLFGALNSQHPEANVSRVNQLIQNSIVLRMGSATATLYARIRISLRQKGRPIPENDIWIAASCLEHEVALVTNDAHFQWIEGLKLEIIS